MTSISFNINFIQIIFHLNFFFFFLGSPKGCDTLKNKKRIRVEDVEGKLLLLLLLHLNQSGQRLKDQIFQEFTRQKMTIIQIPIQQLLSLLMEILHNKIQLL